MSVCHACQRDPDEYDRFLRRQDKEKQTAQEAAFLLGEHVQMLVDALLGTYRRLDAEGRPCWCVGEFIGQRHVKVPHSDECLQARAALSAVNHGGPIVNHKAK